ncbi:MAG: hypothetical protein V4555_13945, partial [Acidobacteriota bacterium]
KPVKPPNPPQNHKTRTTTSDSPQRILAHLIPSNSYNRSRRKFAQRIPKRPGLDTIEIQT